MNIKKVEKSTAKRQQILDSAVAVFAEKGFYNAKVTDIAHKAGIAHGTVYLYFQTKEDILIQIFEEKFEELVSYIFMEVGTEQNALAKLRRLILVQLQMIETNPELTELMLLEARQSSKFILSSAISKIGDYCDKIEGILKEGIEEGLVRPDLDLTVASTMLYSGIEGIATRWML
ncbi:MAG: TetR family transcriptional regulator, partial [Candidatus Poribacteria bacterium]|nr:TetR family transcriptional regulator [Candidatus Poribacteria bacterium]